jgi:hypothetical protein
MVSYINLRLKKHHLHKNVYHITNAWVTVFYNQKLIQIRFTGNQKSSLHKSWGEREGKR